jgi:hypothetical protein
MASYDAQARLFSWPLGVIAPTYTTAMHGFLDGRSQQPYGQARFFLNPPLGWTKVSASCGHVARAPEQLLQRHSSSTNSGEARRAQDTGDKVDEVPPLVARVPCLTKLPSPYPLPLQSLTHSLLHLPTDGIDKIKSYILEMVPKFPFFRKNNGG